MSLRRFHVVDCVCGAEATVSGPEAEATRISCSCPKEDGAPDDNRNGDDTGPGDGGHGDAGQSGDEDLGLALKTRPKTKRPPMYKVLILNDDYTPMEFVVHILERYFGMNHAKAFEIMLTVHKKGLAVVGVYSFEVAETKVIQVMDCARRNQHPLQCTMEKE